MSGLIIQRMVINMDESQLRTIEQIEKRENGARLGLNSIKIYIKSASRPRTYCLSSYKNKLN